MHHTAFHLDRNIDPHLYHTYSFFTTTLQNAPLSAKAILIHSQQHFNKFRFPIKRILCSTPISNQTSILTALCIINPHSFQKKSKSITNNTVSSMALAKRNPANMDIMIQNPKRRKVTLPSKNNVDYAVHPVGKCLCCLVPHLIFN